MISLDWIKHSISLQKYRKLNIIEQCAFCGNKHLTPKTTRYLHQRGEDRLFVEQVPCVECDFCGEQYFDIQVLKKIESDHLE